MIVPFWWHLLPSMLDWQSYKWGKCQTLTSWLLVTLLEKELKQWFRRFCSFSSQVTLWAKPTQWLGWDKKEGAMRVTGEVIFHTGEKHFGLKIWVAESKLRSSQQCASSGTIWVCRTSVPELRTDPNITWTLWLCWDVHFSCWNHFSWVTMWK